MISVRIKGKQCDTISDFYAITIPKIKYDHSDKPIRKVEDFYKEFLIDGNRLLQKDVVEAWHKLLMWYIDQPDAPLFVRKYEAGKNEGEWDNRRGCVVKYEDGFEIVYSSNFLAHDIFLMAYHGFVPSKTDFMASAKNRMLHITSGTKVEKAIRLYPSANKGLSYCYLAHIMDVNGSYLRNDGSYKKLSKSEINWIFPRGTVNDWKKSSDKIWHISRKLSDSEKELVKAHCLRFLDPMNYYLTPLTKHCTHTIPGFKKNIGEFLYLTHYVEQQYKNIYKASYDELIKCGRFVEQNPKGYSEKVTINLEYSVNMIKTLSEEVALSDVDSKKTFEETEKIPSDIEDFINELGNFMRNTLSESSVRIYLNKIKGLLNNGYSFGDLCGAIDQIIHNHSKGGKDFDPDDHNNTVAALKQVRKMILYPYICYNEGYKSFGFKDTHLTGYCIDGDKITISKACWFVPLPDETRKISKKDMQSLLDILDEANAKHLFQKSNSCLYTEHGKGCSFDYSYGRNSGTECGRLFIDRKLAQSLQVRYVNLITKLTK